MGPRRREIGSHTVTEDHRFVSDGLAARWREQLARLERASAAEAEQLDERFEAVDEILTDELYLRHV